MLVLVALLTALVATPAEAYVDPGAGSLLMQLLFGGVAGLLVLIKLYWRRLLARLGLTRADPAVDRGHPTA